MDWKQFALLGSSDLEPYAILLVRVSLGLFFAISGADKLFVAGSRQTMYETLVEAKVPFPHLMTYFVSGVEFVGGSLLTVGFLSSLACMALLVDMLVAILTTKLSAMPNRPWQNPPLLEDDLPTRRRHDLRRKFGAEALMPVPNRSERALDCVSGEYKRN